MPSRSPSHAPPLATSSAPPAVPDHRQSRSRSRARSSSLHAAPMVSSTTRAPPSNSAPAAVNNIGASEAERATFLNGPPRGDERESSSPHSQFSRSPELRRSLSSSQSSTSHIPRLLENVQGTNYEVFRPADLPVCAEFAEAGKKIGNGGAEKRGVKRPAEVYGPDEAREKRRKYLIKEVLREDGESSSVAIEDDEDVDWFPSADLPEWLHAEREFQPNGRPGTYLLKPSKEDFPSRFEEIIRIMEPVGKVLGAIKIKDPREPMEKPTAWPQFLSQNPIDPGTTAPSNACSSKSRSASPVPPSFRKQTPTNPSKRRYEDHHTCTSTGEPLIYTMEQFLPRHPSMITRTTPRFEVVSKDKSKIPISQWCDLSSANPNARIPEQMAWARGRNWANIFNDNPAAAYRYSSDNDASPRLRSYLGISDPHLTEFPGNALAGSITQISGIHSPYIYLGAPYSTFAMHMEDYSALSLNYHHFGAAKSWRIISPLDFDLMEDFVRSMISGRDVKCSQFVRHSSVFIPGKTLVEAGIRSVLLRQFPGELVVTFPMAYHQGWNEGWNVNEAVGYGDKRWREVWVDGNAEGGVYRVCEEGCGGKGTPVVLEFERGVKREDEDLELELEFEEEVEAVDVVGI